MHPLGSPRPPGSASDAFRLGLVVPLQGPAGSYGPSCEACAQLAVEELNLGKGLLGREVQLVTIDGGAAPDQVADEVRALVAADGIDALTGWHISPVRQAILDRVADMLPYVYTTLYEGGEVCGSPFVPLGTTNFDGVRRTIEHTEATGVLMLLGSGAKSTRGVHAAAAYFDDLDMVDNTEFHDLYARRLGDTAPALHSQGESCYEAIELLTALLHGAGSADPVEVDDVADTVGYSGPRGQVHLRDGHLQQAVYLAEADGLQFDIVTSL